MEVDSRVAFQARLVELELGELSQNFDDLGHVCSKLNCKATIVWAGNRHKPRVPIRVSNLLEDVNVEEIIGVLQAGEDLNWDTYAKLAFAVPSSAPGFLDEDVFKRQVPTKLFVIPQGQDMPAQATVVRRFWYESHVLFVGNMRQKLERSEDDAPKRMPHAEQEERANVLTKNTATIALAAAPTFLSSLKTPGFHLWVMPCMQDVAELLGAFSTIFQACMSKASLEGSTNGNHRKTNKEVCWQACS